MKQPRLPRREQRGIVLIVALIVLVVMALAGLAMLRQLSAGVSIAGNVAFKENATSVADSGVETARAWMVANSATLHTDAPANGYYSSWVDGADPAALDWSDARSVKVLRDTGTGNTVRYVLQRLCATAGMLPNDPSQRCSDSVARNIGPSHTGGSYGSLPITPPPQPFFRVTTRVEGPRNTVSYTQVLMQ